LRLVLRCGVGRSECITRETALCAERGAVAIYDIRIAGHLDKNWAEWFDGLTITNLDNGTTQLSGDLVDQAALHGTLNKVRNLNLTLMSVTSLESPTGQKRTAPTPTHQEGDCHAGPTNHLRTRAAEN
jgi:hypothetical protein